MMKLLHEVDEFFHSEEPPKGMKFNLGRGCCFSPYKDENYPMGWIWCGMN
jgi:hypothetical protein